MLKITLVKMRFHNQSLMIKFDNGMSQLKILYASEFCVP